MSHGDPQWLRVGAPEAIAALSVPRLAGAVLLHPGQRARSADACSISASCYMVLTAVALGHMFHWEPMPADRYADRTRDLLDRRHRADVCRHRPEHAGSRRVVAGLIAVSMNPMAMLIARARGTWHVRVRRPTSLLMHYPDYPARRRGGRHLARGHVARPAGREGAGDGQLPARRAARPRRHGRGLQGDAPDARPAGGDQADSAGDARRRAIPQARSSRSRASGAKRRRRPTCARRTPSSSTTSA